MKCHSRGIDPELTGIQEHANHTIIEIPIYTNKSRSRFYPGWKRCGNTRTPRKHWWACGKGKTFWRKFTLTNYICSYSLVEAFQPPRVKGIVNTIQCSFGVQFGAGGLVGMWLIFWLDSWAETRNLSYIILLIFNLSPLSLFPSTPFLPLFQSLLLLREKVWSH